MTYTITLIAIVFLACFGGYCWGKEDRQEEDNEIYAKAYNDAAQLFRSSLVRLNGKIRGLEEENDRLKNGGN